MYYNISNWKYMNREKESDCTQKKGKGVYSVKKKYHRTKYTHGLLLTAKCFG